MTCRHGKERTVAKRTKTLRLLRLRHQLVYLLKAAARDNVRIQKNTGASARPINHSRPAGVGDASVAPFRLVCLFLVTFQYFL